MTSASGEFRPIEDATLSSGDSIMGEAVALARLGPGKQLGRYLVLARLSVGAAGVMYAVYDPRADARRLVRMLRPLSDKSEGEALHRAALGLAALAHPNLARVHEVDNMHGVTCLVFEHLPGTSLRTWLDRKPRAAEPFARPRPRPWPEVLELFCAIGSGLAAAHRADVIHGSLQPDNVQFDEHGTAKLTNFPLAVEHPGPTRPARASKRSEDNSPVESPSASLLRAGGHIGAAAYISPEQHAGAPVDARSDQFGFCVMLYEALYGALPFTSHTIAGLRAAIAEARLQPAPPSSKVPRWLRALVVRGLARDPAQRWPSMDALLDALSHRPRPRRRTLAVASSAVLLIAALGVLAQQSWLRSGPPPSATTAAHDRQLAALGEALHAHDDAHALELACELGLRLELAQLEQIDRSGDAEQLRMHLDRALIFAERLPQLSPELSAALAHWHETAP